MHHPILRHLRANVMAYLALGLALGAGGGYALAATNTTRTITVCTDKMTGVLHLHARGRCKRGQTSLSWNQKGAQGATGSQGPSGAAGAPAVSVWADVTDPGTVLAGQGLSVQHASAGTYQVTVTAGGCAQGFNAPVVSVSDSYPPAGQVAGAFPVAWVGDTGTNQQFTVHTGVVVGGVFTPTDHTFNLQDSCS
jgi:hypothetical protein